MGNLTELDTLPVTNSVTVCISSLHADMSVSQLHTVSYEQIVRQRKECKKAREEQGVKSAMKRCAEMFGCASINPSASIFMFLCSAACSHSHRLCQLPHV